MEFYSHKEWNCVACNKMDGTGDHQVKQSKPDSERQIPLVFLLGNLDIKTGKECKHRTVWEGASGKVEVKGEADV
jgi:hypothetical protein